MNPIAKLLQLFQAAVIAVVGGFGKWMQRHGWGWLGLGLLGFVAYDVIHQQYPQHKGVGIAAATIIGVVGLCFLYRPKGNPRRDIDREHGRGSSRRTDGD